MFEDMRVLQGVQNVCSLFAVRRNCCESEQNAVCHSFIVYITTLSQLLMLLSAKYYP